MSHTRAIWLTGAVLATGLGGFGTGTAEAQNPVVDRWGWQRSGYDPWRDHWQVDRYRARARESAYDWDRGYVDPGSYQYVNRYVRDEYGRLVREYGPTWTTHGQPHGRLTRDRVTQYPGGWHRPGYTERDRDVIIFSQPQTGGSTTPAPVSPTLPEPASGVTERDRDVIIFSQPAQTGPARPGPEG